MSIDVLIVEDEPLLAQRIERFLRTSKLVELGRMSIKPNLPSAKDFLSKHTIDLLLLDLDLHGKDGFELLKLAVSQSFQTIIISAYTEKAIEAFEYGVLDFVSKPFNQLRIEKALNRLLNRSARVQIPLKYLAVIKNQKLQLVQIEDVLFLKGAGNYTELHLLNGQIELHSKSLQNILPLLPSSYERIHKSYIVNLNVIESISYQYEILLKNQTKIPISRTKYQAIKNRIA
ncbi:MAG: LytTR family DNA-binding domain-containing protein [Bacteroidota bacterium]